MSFQSFSPTAKVEKKAAGIVKSILSSSVSVISANFVVGSTSAATLLFSRPDLEEFEPRKFCRHIVFREDYGKDDTLVLPDIPVDERVKARAFGSDGCSCEARIVAGAESKEPANGASGSSLFLEVYDNNQQQLVRRRLPDDVVEVRNGGPFGELIVYGTSYVLIPGERRPPKYPKTWWSTKASPLNGVDGDAGELEGSHVSVCHVIPCLSALNALVLHHYYQATLTRMLLSLRPYRDFDISPTLERS